jgi:hypothetical protein
MGVRWQDHGGGALPRVSQSRFGRRQPPQQPALPLWRAGDRVSWGEQPAHQGVVERVLPDETVDVREDGSRRIWRLPMGKLSRR